METPSATVNPWEQRETLGTWNALLAAAKQSLFEPTAYFAGTPREGGLTGPLYYGAIFATLGIAFGQLWNLLMQLASAGLTAASGEEAAVQTAMMQGGINVVFAVIAILFSPVGAVLGLFVTSAFAHLGLLIVGGARRGFETTFRAVAYAQAPMGLAVVPFIGGIVGGLWTVGNAIIGLKEMHEIEWWQAIVGYLLIGCTCTLLIIGGVIAIVIAAIGAGAFAAAA